MGVVPEQWGPIHNSEPFPSVPVTTLKSLKTISVLRVGALVSYRLELGMEHLFLLSSALLGRGEHCSKIYEVQAVVQPHQHLALISWSNPNDRGLPSARDGYSHHSFATNTIALT